MPTRCTCGATVVHFAQHYRFSPHCEPPTPEPPPRKRDSTAHRRLFHQRVLALLVHEMLKAHFDLKISKTDLAHMMAIIMAVVRMILCFIESSVSRDPATACSDVQTVFDELPSVTAIINSGKKKYLRVEPLIFKGVSSADKRGAVFFSVYQLITVMLQESKTVRTESRKSNTLWKSGDLFNKKPAVYSDVIHGSRFWTNEAICGKATEDEKKDFRCVINGWTDEFTTVDGLSTVAKENKYGVVLGSLVNLPLHMRLWFDYVLLLCIYQARYAKKHGGLVRMLTGVDVDGKQHGDGLTLAAELNLGSSSPMIELPNDDDETSTEPELWRLRVFLLLISVDWLASGDFGPFASSVSARYPCGKCLWTQSCPCAFKPSDATVTHSDHCRACAPRTHDSVMEVVQELRAWTGTKAQQLKARMTATGIMSCHFASEHLLRNVVKDVCIDYMHVGPCGIARYMLSWVTDILCPEDFTFDEFNGRKNRHRFGAGVHVPDVERAKGDKRRSCTIKLNGAQMMALTNARW